jgi:ABC-type phosphate/phosphonate transport system ATPase subunit
MAQAAGQLMLHFAARDIQLKGLRISLPEMKIPPGMVRVSGENGSGKSTLIRHLMLELAGCAKAFAFVPQDYRSSLFPWRRTAFNLGIYGRYAHSLAALEKLGFAQSDLGKRTYQLSGGQCQKIAIARELCRDVAVAFFDEPFSSIDRESCQRVMSALNSFLCAGTNTLFLVSHQEVAAHGKFETLTLSVVRSEQHLAEVKLTC